MLNCDYRTLGTAAPAAIGLGLLYSILLVFEAHTLRELLLTSWRYMDVLDHPIQPLWMMALFAFAFPVFFTLGIGSVLTKSVSVVLDLGALNCAFAGVLFALVVTSFSKGKKLTQGGKLIAFVLPVAVLATGALEYLMRGFWFRYSLSALAVLSVGLCAISMLSQAERLALQGPRIPSN
jgi:hypothetical protein